MENVNAKMSALYQKDKYGRIPLVTEEDRQQLIKLHEDLGEAAEKAILKGGTLEKPVLDTLKKLNGLNNAYRSAMQRGLPAPSGTAGPSPVPSRYATMPVPTQR
ncbi:MAG: hypothetical protein IJK77_09055 [Lachnospiraceae bacterium]|nr:hypothetical protein [Lachnospiraceae bacterium]